MAKKPKGDTMAGIIAARIKNLGITPYRVSVMSGVSHAVLSRFLSGERGLNLATVEKLCKALDLVLTVKPGSTLYQDLSRERWEREEG
jgi:hypothetical protein